MRSEGYPVCLCRRLFWHYWLRGGDQREPEKQKGDFSEIICCENKCTATWLAPVYLGGSGSHTKIVYMYRLPHAIYYCNSQCQTLRELLAGDHELTHTNSPAPQLAVLRMRSSPGVCTSVFFILNLARKL